MVRLTSPIVVLGVNRQFHSEVSQVFYSKNIWVIGQGPWASTRLTNQHGKLIPLQNPCLSYQYNRAVLVLSHMA